MYCELLYTVMHQLGAQDKAIDLSPGDLFVYAQEVLFLSSAHTKFLPRLPRSRRDSQDLAKMDEISARICPPRFLTYLGENLAAKILTSARLSPGFPTYHGENLGSKNLRNQILAENLAEILAKIGEISVKILYGWYLSFHIN